ncbi:hypothetical protein M9H77_14481 [Catharanthus roseus]|uniref:Uncharacterized protein n=1 Tax=Catharanthus roseus TaxID=4058 RepID=A0ACC0BND2_CATRO|nr:hypothetical protein M9H77_14481 [Catharanthus roseus]
MRRVSLIFSVGVLVAVNSSVTVRLPVKKEPLEVWILKAFTDSETDDDLILRARGFMFLLLAGHMLLDFSGNLVHVTQHASHVEVWHQWRLRVRDGPILAVIVLSYPNDEYIRWYQGITRVHIENSGNRDTRSIGYQPAGVDKRMMEIDDMVSVVIQEPPSSPSHKAVFVKKVQTIIQRCMVYIGGTLSCTPSQHNIQQTFPVQQLRRRSRELVPEQGAHGVKRGAHRQPGHIPCFSLGLTPTSQSLPNGSGTVRAPPPPSLGFASFQSLHHTSLGFSSFRAPPPLGTAGSSTPHQPISQASSFDEEERGDDTDDLQHLGLGHRFGKKTTRFTPSDWL